MKLKIATVGLCAVMLAACAPKPEPVYVSPSYDKYGAPSCTAGYDLATTEAGQTVCTPISG